MTFSLSIVLIILALLISVWALATDRYPKLTPVAVLLVCVALLIPR